MKKLLLATAALAALVASPALAADIRQPPPPPTRRRRRRSSPSTIGAAATSAVMPAGCLRQRSGPIASRQPTSAAMMPTASSRVRRSAAIFKLAVGCSVSKATMPRPTPKAATATSSASQIAAKLKSLASVTGRIGLCLGPLPRLREGWRRLGARRLQLQPRRRCHGDGQRDAQRLDDRRRRRIRLHQLT